MEVHSYSHRMGILLLLIEFFHFCSLFDISIQPLQRLRDELKSYSRRHNMAELGERVKQLFEGYNILENFEQLQVSETYSRVPEEGTRSSDDVVHSSSSVTGTRKLMPKALNTTDATVQAAVVKESAKKDATGKDNHGMRTRRTWNKNSADVRLASETAGHNISKKSQKPSKQESNEHKNKLKMHAEKSASEQGNPPTIRASNFILTAIGLPVK